MANKTISIDMACTHEQMVDGKLKLYLYLSNLENDIPLDWHDTDDSIDLLLHFSIDLIAETMIDMHRLMGYGEKVTVMKSDKPMFDQLIDQLERSLEKVKSITYKDDQE